MGVLQAGFLGAAFMAVADLVVTGGLGMVGLHGFVVEAGVSLGQELGVPQLDWINLWENLEVDFIDPVTDSCLASGGHYHGSFCHYGSDFSIPEIPNPEGNVLKLQ